MEGNQGLTLDKYLAQRGPLAPAQVTRVALELAQQLKGSSDASIVYPGRILVGKDGTARLLPLPVEDLALPVIVEFPAYAAPELIQGKTPDERSCLYSVGCTLFELLAGQPPYGGRDPRAVLKAHVETPAPDIRQFCVQVRDGLAELLKELLEKDPELRIQSHQELLRRVRQVSVHADAPGKPAKKSPAAAAQGRPAPPARKEPAARPASLRREELRRSAGASPAPKGPRRRSSAQLRGAAAAGRRPRPTAGDGAGREGGQGRERRLRREKPRRENPLREERPARGARRSAVTSRSRSGRGRLQRGRQEPSSYLDLEDELEDESAGRVIRRKGFYPFSIGGACLGLLIGLALVVSSVKASKGVPEYEEEVIRQAAIEKLEGTKTALAEKLADQKKQIQSELARIQNVSEDLRRDALVEKLRAFCTYPDAFQLARELIRLGPTPGTPGAAQDSTEETEETRAYKALMAAAGKLFDEGKYAEARDRVLDEYNTYKAHHDADMTAFTEKCDEEMVAQWKKDQEEIDSLVVRGDIEKALEICRGALVYGDSMIRKEAEQKITGLENQLDFQGVLAREDEEPIGEDPLEGESTEDEELSALEKEFEEFTSEETPSESEGAGDPLDGWDKEIDDEEL